MLGVWILDPESFRVGSKSLTLKISTVSAGTLGISINVSRHYYYVGKTKTKLLLDLLGNRDM